MTTVAVVAHAKKSLGGGLGELRTVLAREGVTEPLWFEVPKSRKAPKRVKRALEQGAEVIFVWGGDGMVQRCADAMAGSQAVLAILPAGTANLLATNLRIPADITEAVRAGLHGERRALDTGMVNGEHFAVMAGAGFDASMIKAADRSMKDRFGRAAYVYTGAKNLTARPVKAAIEVDGTRFYRGKVSCVLIGNVGTLFGGVEVFPDARPDDGLLEVGVVTAKNPVEWARTLGRVALGKPENSPFVQVTCGKKIRLRFSRPFRYELDGGARSTVEKMKVDVHPAAIRVSVPAGTAQTLGS
jgi:YegS/Rv2252/BmrU family lipid kinase